MFCLKNTYRFDKNTCAYGDKNNFYKTTNKLFNNNSMFRAILNNIQLINPILFIYVTLFIFTIVAFIFNYFHFNFIYLLSFITFLVSFVISSFIFNDLDKSSGNVFYRKIIIAFVSNILV